jgi:hypothetical protein
LFGRKKIKKHRPQINQEKQKIAKRSLKMFQISERIRINEGKIAELKTDAIVNTAMLIHAGIFEKP